jgi:hypothetical protein
MLIIADSGVGETHEINMKSADLRSEMCLPQIVSLALGAQPNHNFA